MKFLNDEKFNALTAQADAFGKVVAHITKSGDIKAEEVTAESIIEALQQESGDEVEGSKLLAKITDLQTKNEDLQKDITAKDAKIKELQAQLDEMDETPAEESAAIVSKGEQNGKSESVTEFADKNAGNTAAILAKAKEEGLL